MPKGYWVASVEISDVGGYDEYRSANAAVLKKYGGTFLIRGGQQEVREGTSYQRTVVIEFPDYDTAVRAYEDPAYQAAAAIRRDAATGRLVIVEGYNA